MLLGSGEPGQSEGTDLASGVELGAVRCLGEAADQQRVTRAIVTQVKRARTPVCIYDHHQMPCLALP